MKKNLSFVLAILCILLSGCMEGREIASEKWEYRTYPLAYFYYQDSFHTNGYGAKTDSYTETKYGIVNDDGTVENVEHYKKLDVSVSDTGEDYMKHCYRVKYYTDGTHWIDPETYDYFYLTEETLKNIYIK